MNIENSAELTAYLRGAGRIGPDETPRLTVLAGGVSNRTVLLQRERGPAWVLKQALAKLRVASDWFSSPERIHREALGLRWLGELAPPGVIPRLVFADREHDFLAMEAVPQPHENWKTMLLRGEVGRDLVEQFGQLLGGIHRKARARRDELEPVFRDTSFFESLRLEPYYAHAASRTREAAAFLRELIAETRATRVTLAHGDFSPKNILVRNGSLVLLDHEVIHWGDPAFDIGFSMAHFLSKAHHLRAHREMFARAAQWYWESYEDNSCEKRAVRHTLGCLLARVDGKSPLEYLDANERSQQRAAVLRLMGELPSTIGELTEKFIACL
jgi:aminoglycoside phosphotransferase (APT) family kinase protein